MNDPKTIEESFLAPLHRHFINLMCFDTGPEAKAKSGGQHAIYNFSAFIVSVDGRWFAITAGHIFSCLKFAVAHGAILSNWQIDDSIISKRPQQTIPIPLDIEKDVMWIHDEIPGMDYAFIEINIIARMALEAEGICAIPPDIWNSEDIAAFPLWLMVGTPTSLSRLQAGKPIEKCHVTIQLDREREIPSGIEDVEYERLYARINFQSVDNGEERFDIAGMSGGPIFGLRADIEKGISEYRIIGIQSGWNKADHVVMCAAAPFIGAMAQIAAKKAS